MTEILANSALTAEQIRELDKAVPNFRALVEGREDLGESGFGTWLQGYLPKREEKLGISALTESDPAMTTSAVTTAIAAIPSPSYLDTSDSPVFLFQGDGDGTDDASLAPALQANAGTLQYGTDVFVDGLQCFRLDGATQLTLATAAYDATLQNTGDKVISFLGLPVTNGCIAGVLAANDRIWQVFFDSNGKFGVGWHDASNVWQPYIYTAGADYRGQLAHYVVQIVSNNASLWVNKTKLGTSSGLNAPGANANAELYVGDTEAGTNKITAFVGSLALYHGTKTDSFVQGLFDDTGFTS